MQLEKAEKRKSTFSIIGCMVEAEKGVRHIISILLVNITSINIFKDVLANLFDAFNTDYIIAIVPKMPVVSIVGITFAKPYINFDTLFKK